MTSNAERLMQAMDAMRDGKTAAERRSHYAVAIRALQDLLMEKSGDGPRVADGQNLPAIQTR